MDRSRRLLWPALAAGAALVLVVAPADGPERVPEAAAGTASPAAAETVPPAAAATAPPAAAETIEVAAGPPRGSLAGEEAFVEAVRRLPWSADEQATGADPATGRRSVVFAGDVPGGRWALVVGRAPEPRDAPRSPAEGSAERSGVVAVWFGGPRGAPAEELTRLTAPARAPVDAPLGMLDQRTGTLVVVAAPGDVVEVSERPVIARNGEISRGFREVATTDGVAVARLRPSDVPVSSAAVYQVRRSDRTVARAVPVTVGTRPGNALPVALDEPRGPTGDTAAPVVSGTAERLLAPLGLARHELRVAVVWAGNLPGPGPEAGSAAVVAVTLPSGAVVVDGEWLLSVDSASGDYLQGGDCGLGILPSGPPVEQRVHALGCEVVDPTSGAAFVRTVLLVVAPPHVELVRLYDNASHFLAELPTVNGLVIAPMPRLTATVEAVTAAGVSLGRTELMRRGIDFAG